MVDFYALLEKYLVMLQLEKEKIEQRKLLLRAYAERPNCYKAFVKQTNTIHKELDKLPYRDEVYFLEKQQLYLLHYGHPGTEMQSEGKASLALAKESFEAFKKIAEVKLRCASNARVNTFGEDKNMDEFKRTPLGKNIVFEVYEKLNQLQLSAEGTAELQQLSDHFISNIDLFRQEDQANILKILLNYCIRLINLGRIEFISTSFALYKTGLQHHCLFQQGTLKESTFHNIISMSTNCKEFEWTKKFIDDYKYKLDSSVREDAMAFGMGQLYFKKGEFEKAIEVLQHSFRNPLEVIKVKSLLIRIWYELFEQNDHYYDLLINQLDAYEKFIRREKAIPPSLAKGCLKFIMYTKKLASGNDGKRHLMTAISKEPNLAFKNWLLEKTN